MRNYLHALCLIDAEDRLELLDQHPLVFGYIVTEQLLQTQKHAVSLGSSPADSVHEGHHTLSVSIEFLDNMLTISSFSPK